MSRSGSDMVPLSTEFSLRRATNPYQLRIPVVSEGRHKPQVHGTLGVGPTSPPDAKRLVTLSRPGVGLRHRPRTRRTAETTATPTRIINQAPTASVPASPPRLSSTALVPIQSGLVAMSWPHISGWFQSGVESRTRAGLGAVRPRMPRTGALVRMRRLT